MGELSGEPGVRGKPTSTELMDRLGLNSDAFRENVFFGGGNGNVPRDFGYAEDQKHAESAPGESDVGAMKGVKWWIPVFYEKTTSSWRCSEMEFLMTMRHFRLDYVLEDEKDTNTCSSQGSSSQPLARPLRPNERSETLLSMESNFKRVVNANK